MAEPVAARLVHRLPGRLRLRVEARRGDREWLDRLALDLAQVEGVRGVETNASTASLLVRHDGPTGALLERIRGLGLVRLDTLEPSEPPMRERLAGRLARLDRDLARATRGELDLEGAALLGLLLLALVQAARGRLVGPALSLLWYARGLIGPPRP